MCYDNLLHFELISKCVSVGKVALMLEIIVYEHL